MAPAGQQTGHRRGAAAVEGAVVLGVFLLILLGGLDLSLAVFRENVLAEGARRLARAAIVRGENAAEVTEVWGPASYDGYADDETAIAASIRDILATLDPAEVRIRVEWPDGGNDTGDRVRVTLEYRHDPIVASLLGASPYLLQCESTMTIEH